MRLLDAEGLTGISMRAPAAEMNVTAMPVYWYVDTKHYLLELALDAALGEPSGPEPGSDEEWRGQLRALADEFRALLERHPWLTVAGMNGEAREQDFEYALELLVSGIEAMAARD